MAEHTPGPWQQNGPNLVEVSSRFSCPIEMASDYVAMTPDRAVIDAEQEANARLIAAAPDLLGALEGLLANAPAHKGVKRDYSYILHLEAARTAVAKARGQT